MILLWGVPPLIGLLAACLGKSVGWDFLNYHWYNPYALLHGRLGFDLAVAHHATFYNPLLDLPFYLAARQLPAAVAVFLLGTAQGGNFSLMLLLAEAVLPLENGRARLVAATAIAAAGMGGAGALGQLGGTSGDILASLGVLAMLCLLARRWSALTSGSTAVAMSVVLLAGLLAGLTTGLKLTMAIYPTGFGLMLLLRPLVSRRRRLLVFAAFCAGGALGFAVTAGPWMFQVWRMTGNPLFPYFNDLIGSPLLPAASFRDLRFLPKAPWEYLVYPLLFTMDPLRVAEFHFRDVHILLLAVLLPLALFVPLWRRGPGRAAPDARISWLLLGACCSYLLWLRLFSIYRYLIVLEMLAPLLLVLALHRLGLRRRAWLSVAVLLLLGSQAAVSFSSHRLPLDHRFVEVTVPEIRRPDDTMVLMTGYRPMAYVIPSFPPQIPFLRIHGYLTGPPPAGRSESGFFKEIRRRVESHRGALFLLYHPSEEKAAHKALGAFGLQMATADCQAVTANIDDPLRFCRVQPLDTDPATAEKETAR
ncbi:MAG: hypothetical protein AB1568_10490 [Thermodesulfobacteriota bacterium]